MDTSKIVEAAKKLNERYLSEVDDETEKHEQSFLDEVNDLIRQIFGDRSTDIYTVLTPEALERWKRKRLRRALHRLISRASWRSAFMLLMMVFVTSFLVMEAASFYMVASATAAYAYAKAILTELSFLFLSAYRASSRLELGVASMLRASIFVLMVFVISSDVIKTGVKSTTEISRISEKIALLEEQIKEKDTAIDFYRRKGWGVNMRKQLDEKDKLVAELLKLKQEQIEGKSHEVADQIRYQTWARAVFRVILVLLNMLIARRLFSF